MEDLETKEKNEIDSNHLSLDTGVITTKQHEEEAKRMQVVQKPGYAPIKPEFILQNYKPSIQTEYLSSDVKEKIDLVKKENAEENPDNNDSLGKRSASNNAEDHPPGKMPKLKGRNKQRPKKEKIQAKDRMCPAIKDGRTCNYGSNCKFNHNKEDFMANKLPDIPGSCYNFEKFGYCKYGIACRYAKNHLTEDFQNVVNEELFDQQNDKKNINCLDADVRQKLWKRNYDYSKADTIVKTIQKNFSRGFEFRLNHLQKLVKDTEQSDSCSKIDNEFDKNKIVADSGDNTRCSSETGEITNVDGGCESTDITNGSNIKTAGSECKEGSVDIESNIPLDNQARSLGQITDEELFPLKTREKVKIDFSNKLYLAPLTTVGNLPFRRICKEYGADITCGEMALATQILQGKQSEWSLLKRHPSEDLFGVQICGGFPDTMTRCAQLLTETCDLDFIDINCGCPIDLIYKKGSGSALMGKATKLEQICSSMLGVMGDTPLTVKLRTGVHDDKSNAHSIIPRLRDAGVSLVTVHGRSREQRYTRQADWDYVRQCAIAGSPMPVFGNGDVLSFEDANLHMETHGVNGVMIARGGLIKPWLFTEIKEQRHWDISSNERYDMLKKYTNYGLEHWGSDDMGVENTRRFMLEWLSFLYRYIPVGVLERLPQRINEKPPYYMGRNDLETLMASPNCADWVKITEMLLGPVPPTFKFLPKHKANAYQYQ